MPSIQRHCLPVRAVLFVCLCHFLLHQPDGVRCTAPVVVCKSRLPDWHRPLALSLFVMMAGKELVKAAVFLLMFQVESARKGNYITFFMQNIFTVFFYCCYGKRFWQFVLKKQQEEVRSFFVDHFS